MRRQRSVPTSSATRANRSSAVPAWSPRSVLTASPTRANRSSAVPAWAARSARTPPREQTHSLEQDGGGDELEPRLLNGGRDTLGASPGRPAGGRQGRAD